MSGSRRLAITGSRPEDANRGVLRMDPADMAAIGVGTGGLVALAANRTTYARVLPLPPSDRGLARVALDGVTRNNVGAVIGETIDVSAAPAPAPAG